MNITFLIGNGFDLNCGLKTSYKDVYVGYCETPSQSDLIREFKEDIEDDLKQNKGGKLERWGDFEVAMADYMKKFKSEQEFLTCLRDFKNYLNQYLLTVDSEFGEIINYIRDSLYVEMKNSFLGFYKGINNNTTYDIENQQISMSGDRIPSHYKAIIFNYTSAFEKLCNIRNKDGFSLPHVDITHIHGVLNSNVVLGMDSSSQLKDLKFKLSSKGKRAFDKNFFNESFDRRRKRAALDAINGSDVICVFGMSLGISDLTWRKILLNWISKNNQAHLFIYKHHMSDIKVWSADEKMDYEEDAKNDLLLNDWNIDIGAMDSYFDRIHIPCGKNIFNIKSIVENCKNELEDEQEKIRKRLESNKNRPREM